jgi:S-DNA-T family DNA segregation ATPase FtsK/SpoIIIE
VSFRMSRINGDQRRPGVPTRQEKVTVPLWVTMTGMTLRGFWRVLLLVLQHPLSVSVAIVVGALYHRLGPLGLGAALGGLVLAVVAWRFIHRRSYSWAARQTRARFRLLSVYRRRWHTATRHCGLAIREPVSNGEQITFADYYPRIHAIRPRGVVDSLRVELLPGQTHDQWAGKAEGLRHVFRARSCRVRLDQHPGFIWVDFTFTDPLTGLVPPNDLGPIDPEPDVCELPVSGLDGVVVGRGEDGLPWRLPIRGTHVLVAGATGAGKGSVLWSTVRALAPYVAAGLVQLWVADPKGGMELAFGEPMFTRFATTATEIADLLDDAVSLMQARTATLRGVTRLHTPTVTDPLIVVVVDEIASLTAYVTDRDLKRRLGAAMPLLLSQGRAPGVVVLAAVQDPRKDVLPFRDLFPVRVALRMNEPEQADLVLGDSAHDRGARCEDIPEALPGIGYVRADNSPDPIRVRAAWIDDDEIRRIADTYRPPSATQNPGPNEGPSPCLGQPEAA